MSTFKRTIFKRAAAIVGLTLFAAGCGDDVTTSTPASTPATSATAATTVETTPADAETFPTKIVSLSPTHTEMLFAIGAGSQVIAVDDQSNFPAEAAAVASTLSGFTPNIEAIAGYKPDLVVMADDYDGVGDQLKALNIPVWSGPAATSLDDVYAQIEQLGALTGHIDEAVQLSSKMAADVEKIVADLPKLDKPLSFYHELDSTYFSSTSNTFIGAVYAMAGLVNIADTAEAGNDYPQLSSEFIVSASPDLIFLADTKCCAQDATTVAARDGWGEIAAVRNGHVVLMDDDISSRWGPRVVDYLQAVADAVVAAAVPAA
jgi:iron complex transport system substrate-binding protein